MNTIILSTAKMHILLAATTLILLAESVRANKDDSYYIAGTGNPNVNEKMYWKDAENIFQDLGKFEELYVEYHNCAWTWSMTTDADNDVDENDYWYMGKVPPMGANVAYSLYGSLYGENFSGCGEDTFINSFYTNTGYANFAQAMSYAGKSGFSSYTSSSNTCSGGYGVGCDYDNGFAVHTYNTNSCDPQEYSGTKDQLSSLNSALKTAQCVKIYDRSSYSGSPYGTALELLAYSHSCFYQDYFSPDGVCPDPYGKLAYYQKQFYKGIQSSKKQDPYQVNKMKQEYTVKIEEGKAFTIAGAVLGAIALAILLADIIGSWCAASERISQLDKAITAKEAEQKAQLRENDVILIRRSQDMEEDTYADSVSDGGYVHMQDNHLIDIEAAPESAYAPPFGHMETESAALAPGPEVQVNTLDQEAPVTLYAPPALHPTDEAASVPLPISFEQESSVDLLQCNENVIAVPVPDGTPIQEDTSETVAEEAVPDSVAEEVVTEEIVTQEVVTESTITVKKETTTEESLIAMAATVGAMEELIREPDSAYVFENEGETKEEEEEAAGKYKPEEETNARPKDACQEAVAGDPVEEATAIDDLSEVNSSFDAEIEEESVKEPVQEATTENSTESGVEGPEEKPIEETSATSDIQDEARVDEDEAQVDEDFVPEIDPIVASREWDSDSDESEQKETALFTIEGSSPADEPSSEEAAPQQDEVEEGRNTDEIVTHSSMPDLQEDGDESYDQEAPRSQSWFGH